MEKTVAKKAKKAAKEQALPKIIKWIKGRPLKIETLRYFLEHSFVQTFDDADLERLVYDFRYLCHVNDMNHLPKELLQELKVLEELDDWALVAPKLKTHDRSFKPHRAKRLVDRMLACLTDETWDPENHTPFF